MLRFPSFWKANHKPIGTTKCSWNAADACKLLHKNSFISFCNSMQKHFNSLGEEYILTSLHQSWTLISNIFKEGQKRVFSFTNRVLKWNFWNYGICQDILKEQCPRGLLTKNEHFGANCPWKLSPVIIFWGSTQKKLEGFVWSFLSITGWHLRDNFPRNAHF